MKKHFNRWLNRLLSIILTMALIIVSFPAINVHASSNDEYIVLEAIAQSNLKEDCYANSKTVDTVYPGDFVFAISAKTNKYDNLWYQVMLADPEKKDVSEVHAYSGDFILHQCDFQSFEVEENSTLEYCRCGQVRIVEEGLSTQNSAAVALGQEGILSPEDVEAILAAVAAARGYLAAAGASASAAMQALANPYLLVPVVVSGVTILIVMRCDGLSVSIDHVRENYKDSDNSNLEDGKYYCALVLPDAKEVLFMSIPGTEMDLNEAAIFMTMVAQFSGAYRVERKGMRELYGNVYTKNFTDAEKLMKKLVKSGKFTYGGDKGPGSMMSVDKWKVPGAEYYRHYHLYYVDGCFSRLFTHNDAFTGKVPGSHIFWGSPVGIRSAA